MTAAEQFLGRLRERGVRVEVDGNGLLADGRLTDDELDQLRHHKPELLTLLAVPTPPPEDQRSGSPAATPHRVTRAIRHQASQDVDDQVDDEPEQPKARTARQRGPDGRWQSARASAGSTSATTSLDTAGDEDGDHTSPPPRRSFWERLMYGDAS